MSLAVGPPAKPPEGNCVHRCHRPLQRADATIGSDSQLASAPAGICLRYLSAQSRRGLSSSHVKFPTSGAGTWQTSAFRRMSALRPGCVKTCTSRECAELFSLFSSFDGDCKSGSFVIQRNRNKLSTRKFDVGVFTQPAPKADVGAGRFLTQSGIPICSYEFLRCR